jgi:hypothetical protein
MNETQRDALIAAIRVLTVERPHDDPALDEADVAYGLLEDALDTSRPWPAKMPRAALDRIADANAAAFRYEGASARNVKALRDAAEAAFGGDFRQPGLRSCRGSLGPSSDAPAVTPEMYFEAVAVRDGEIARLRRLVESTEAEVARLKRMCPVRAEQIQILEEARAAIRAETELCPRCQGSHGEDTRCPPHPVVRVAGGVQPVGQDIGLSEDLQAMIEAFRKAHEGCEEAPR